MKADGKAILECVDFLKSNPNNTARKEQVLDEIGRLALAMVEACEFSHSFGSVDAFLVEAGVLQDSITSQDRMHVIFARETEKSGKKAAMRLAAQQVKARRHIQAWRSIIG